MNVMIIQLDERLSSGKLTDEIPNWMETWWLRMVYTG